MPLQPPSPAPDNAVPTKPQCVLAFDTSTERLAAALHTPHGSHTLNGEGGAAASARLLPQLQALLAEAGLAYGDLSHVAFGRGPGAFTGLRTSCAVAQGIAFGTGCPVLPLDSLMLVAEDARLQLPLDDGAELAVAMDARMDEAYAARYAWRGGHWQVLDAPALYTLPALAAAWREHGVRIAAGSAVTAFAGRLPLPDSVVAQEHDRAAALLRLAVHAATTSPGIAARDALPLYLRDKVALTTAERDAGRALATGSRAPAATSA